MSDFHYIEMAVALVGTSERATREFQENAAEYVKDLLDERASFDDELKDMEKRATEAEAEVEAVAEALDLFRQYVAIERRVATAIFSDDEEERVATMLVIECMPLFELIREANRSHIARQRRVAYLVDVYSQARWKRSHLVRFAQECGIATDGLTKAELAKRIATAKVHGSEPMHEVV